MADRNEFLGQVQQQLGAWADWMRQLDDQASSTAAQVRADAKLASTQRSEKVRELIRQGRAQWERVSAATDDAWQGISAGAERSWSALQDAAAGLAMQTLPVATELQPAVAPARGPRKAHARSAGRKQPASAKKKSASAARPPRKSKTGKKKAARKKAGKKSAARKSSQKSGKSAKKAGKKTARKSAGARSKAVKRARTTPRPARKK